MPDITVNVPTRDGQAACVFFTPAGEGPWPGVVYFTDVWGIRPATREMAARVAARGYAVLLPNIFYRTHTPPFDPLLTGGARNREMVQSLLSTMDADKMARDGVCYVEYLLGRDDVRGQGASASAGATNKKAAVVGYCFSGAMAVRTAAAAPDKVAAMASFHGGRLVTDQPDSPHTLISKITAALYFGHATQDQSMTAQQIAQLDAVLKSWGGTYQSEIYEGARHGWAVPGGDAYDPVQSERHYAKLFDLLDRTLK